MAMIGPIKYGGLNTRTTVTALGTGVTGNWMDVPRGQMTTCSDFNCLYGTIIPRPFTNVLVASVPDGLVECHGLVSWVDAANYTQAQIIFAIFNTHLYSGPWNANGTITFTDRTGTATIAGSRYQFEVLNNILCGFGGSASTGVPFQVTAYNGNASNLPGSPPSGDVVKVVNNFMFVGRQLGSSTTFSRLTWSNVGDPTTWSAGNFLDFRKNDGDRITSFGAIGTDLYVFKFRSIGRLSVQSITISGSATLGPLVTVYTGIGAWGPDCVDNLPDGRIVFLGSDLRLYIFDGFTLNCLSDQPFPYPNVQPSLDEFPTIDPIRIFIKVYPNFNLVMVGQGTTGTNTRLYAYNWIENFWALWTSVHPTELALVPSYDYTVGGSGYLNLNYSLIEGTYNGKLVQLDRSDVFPVAGDDSAGSVTSTCTVNIPLTGDYYNFIPRAIVLPVGNGTTSFTGNGSNQVVVTFGWDGTLLSSSSFASQNGVVYGNPLIITIPSKKEGTTRIRPQSLQVKIDITSGPIVHPFYLSDEIPN